MMKQFTRRDFLKASVIASSAVLLNACKPSGKSSTSVPAAELDLPFEIADDAVNPLNMPEPVSAEGVFFSGGFGHDYIQFAADLFAKVHPGSTVSVEPIQGVGEKLRPRFVGGNPPDVIDNSGAGSLDFGALVAEGQLTDLTPLMNAPALDTPGKTVMETLFPKSQDGGMVSGKPYALNIAYSVAGIWYSSTLFQEKGWIYPKTWPEMLDLCETIKSAGIAPWTYQGKYPGYMSFGLLQGLIYKKGGVQPMVDIDNLVDGAWGHAAVVDSLKEMYQLAENDYIMTGTEGLNHTESQAEWLKGNAAFIPCGIWLENEMKDMIPDNFNMVIAQSPGDKDACRAEGGEPFIVPSKAKNPIAGMEYLRCIISKESAKYFAVNVSSMMPVLGGTEGVTISTGMQSAVEMVEKCGENVFPGMRYGGWYSDLSKEADAMMGEMLTKRITPEQFVEAVQAMADKVKADPEVTKFTREK
ncbi:MAG: N-acetylglucosamine/diacetylchitobiose ABC transporter substrate-binding protein [Anaerolineae bacterium]|nr:N-acetylglucosamine/diacetylchitobiose ABC transporter substrate-binding protein [Anaerolineae bacterium]